MKEYKVIQCQKVKAEDVMNKRAEDGWEVVAVTTTQDFTGPALLITFVREKQF